MGEVCELEAEEGGGEFSLGRVVGEGEVRRGGGWVLRGAVWKEELGEGWW